MQAGIIALLAGIVGGIGGYFLYPLIGLWFVPIVVVLGIFIGYFGNELLYKLGMK